MMPEPDAPPEEPTATVALARCADYSGDEVERALGELLEALGGMGRLVRRGSTVLLKPNLLSARAPDEAVTTHPAIVAAVARAALGAGGRVALGDSPGVGRFDAVVQKAGLAAVARELEIALEPFDEPVEVERPPGAKFRKLRLARPVLDADTLINLPKVKTHQQMFLTLAVKNLFGCVVGREKIAWHLNAGRDATLFARALVEVALAARPAVSIADGVLGMEGAGPAHGSRRGFGFLAASADPFALDTVVTSLLGFQPKDLPVLAAAREAKAAGLDVGETDPARIEIVGCPPEELQVKGVRTPTTGRLMFLPGWLAWPVRRLVTVKPRVRGSLCRACGVCVGSCPASAIEIIDGRARIDDTSCIRCFCCQELCPHGAVRAKRGLFSGLLSR